MLVALAGSGSTADLEMYWEGAKEQRAANGPLHGAQKKAPLLYKTRAVGWEDSCRHRYQRPTYFTLQLCGQLYRLAIRELDTLR
ncbi:hypothetical protein DdX_15180 [Ditylenchus destructor]|uniref:Uncharacterized protein n=1 Tax=Ditylenchus destructor TaxID=166010 RepID=A0AAD4QUZ6_9BILA|nr:hypothetical protein DdX_15180 [Ditylenchus destructor]